MTVYVVNYDLRNPGRDYQPLWARLSVWRAVRGLESMWFITSSSTAEQLRDDLRQYVDVNDGLFVADLVGPCAWVRLQGNSADYLQTQFRSAA